MKKHHGLKKQSVKIIDRQNSIIVALCGIITFYIISMGCSYPTDVKAPSWDIRFTFPLSDYTYYFSEFLEEADKFTDEQGNRVLNSIGDSLLYLSYHNERPDTFEVYEELKIDPLVKEMYKQEIGRIYVELEDREEVNFPLSDVYKDEVLELSGQKAPIPSITFTDTSALDIGESTRFRRMLFTVDEENPNINNIRFYITNSLPVDIPNLTISICSANEYEDFITGDIMPSGAFISGSYLEDLPRNMPEGEYIETFIPLSGKTVPSGIVFKLEGYTRERGSSETVTKTFSIPVGIDSLTGQVIYRDSTIIIPEDTTDWVEINESLLNAPISIKMEFSRMEVEKVEADITEQRTTQEASFDFRNPQMTIKTAHIATGGLNFDFNNYMPMDLSIFLHLPEFNLDFEIPIPKKMDDQPSTGRQSISFEGAVLSFPDTSNQQISYSVEIVSLEQEGVIITNEDYIDITVTSEEFAIDELTGYLGGKHDIPVMVQEVPLGSMPEGLEGGIRFDSAVMTFGFTLDLGSSFVPMNPHFEITGIKENGLRKTVTIDTTLTSSGDIQIAFQARDLLRLMPDSIMVSGYVAMEKGQLSTFTSSDLDPRFGAKVNNIWLQLEMPIIFSINRTSINLEDVTEMEVDEEMRKYFERGDVKSVLLIGEITNHNPLSGRTFVLVSPDSMSFQDGASQSELALIDTLIDINLPQPRFDSSGNIVQSGNSPLYTGIDSTKFHIFSNEYIYISSVVVLDSLSTLENPDGWIFINPSTDFINIKSRLQMDLFVDSEKIND